MWFLFFSLITFADAPIHLTLKPGEQAPIEMSPTGDIKVSRKGVIHLSAGEKPNWIVTALRRGRVVVQSFNADRSVDKEFFFEVVDNSTVKIKSSKTLQNLPIENVRALFEREFKIKTRIIDISAQQKILSAHCLQEDKSIQKFEKLLESLNLEDQITAVCESWLNPQYFRIQAKVIIRTDGSHRKIGAEYSGSAISPENLDSKIGITPFAQESGGETNIIGEPVVYVGESDSSTVKSGGELQLSKNSGKHSGSNATVWKEYGMQMDASIVAVNSDKILTSIDFQLRHRLNDGNLTLNQIKTKSFLKLNVLSLIGTAQLSSDDQDLTGVPILSSIPIIGPLFQLKKDAKARSQIELWATISPILWNEGA